MSFLDTFVAPKPSKALIGVMTAVTRVFMLKGIPLLRDLWPLNRGAAVPRLANIRGGGLSEIEQALMCS